MAGTKDYLIEFVGTIDKEIKYFNMLYKSFLYDNVLLTKYDLLDHELSLLEGIYKSFYDFINENTDDVFDTYLTLHDNNKKYYRNKLNDFLFIARLIFE